MAALVTVTCAVIGFPVAYYMARIASPRTRRLLVVAMLLPLWASYLVKVFAWRAILQQQGVLNWAARAPRACEGPGYGDVAVWLVFTYLWLPYMILPIFAGLERIPELAAGGLRRPGRPRRHHVPQGRSCRSRFPAVVAGSIFTFSLTLGDYITPSLVSSTQFLGNVVQREVGVSGNLPLAAALAMHPDPGDDRVPASWPAGSARSRRSEHDRVRAAPGILLRLATVAGARRSSTCRSS